MDTLTMGIAGFSTAPISNVTDPTAAQDAATKHYVDTVSGSIGADLNHQVLSLYNYVDNASGSCAQNLQSVTNVGNVTNNEVIAGTLSSNGNIYVNKNGADGDSYLYFYQGASPTGAYLKFIDATARFYFSTLLQANGGIIGSYLASNGAVYVNYDGPDGSAIIYFYEGTAQGANIYWSHTNTRFETSHGFALTGDLVATLVKANSHIYINYDGADGDSYLYFYDNSSAGGAYLMWDDAPGIFVLSHGLQITNQLRGTVHTQNITAVSNTLLNSYYELKVNPDSDYIMTSAPTVSTTNAVEGDRITITCAANSITLQTDGTLAGSKLKLGATTRMISSNDILALRFNGTYWVELSFTNV
jgi:hypothetical protein